MSVTEDQLCTILCDLDRYVGPDELCGATLFLTACRVPHGDLESVQSLFDLYKAIRKNYHIFREDDAIIVLQCALREAGAPADKVNLLGSNEWSIEACLERKKLARLVLCLSRGLEIAEFENLKHLAQDRIMIHPRKVDTRAKFFTVCLNQRVFEKEETLGEFKRWLEALKRDDLANTLEEYIVDWKKDQSTSNCPPSSSQRTLASSETEADEEQGSPPHKAEFNGPMMCTESQTGGPQGAQLVNAASQGFPKPPTGIPITASLRGSGVGTNKDISSSVQEIERRVPSVASAEVSHGQPPRIFVSHPQREAIDQRVPDDNDLSSHVENLADNEAIVPVCGSINHEKAPLIQVRAPSHKRNVRESFCRRHRFKILCGGILIASILIASLLILLAVFFLLAGYHSHVDTRPREVELRPYEGAAVVCGQDHWLIKSLHLEQNVSADDYDGVYNVGVYSASDEELEKLKQTRFSNFSEDNGFQPSYPRLTLPRGTANRLPYLMPGSTVTVNICLESNREEPLNNAHLYIYNNRFAYSDYIHNLTNSTSDTVYNSSLEIGTNGHGICTEKEYPVTKENSGYYEIILDVPSYQGVTVNYSISAHVVYIDSSNLSDAKLCQIPCSVRFPPSYHKRTLLCFMYKSITIPYTAYLIAESKELFSPLGTQIGGFGLVAFSIAIVLSVTICCIVGKLKKTRPGHVISD